MLSHGYLYTRNSPAADTHHPAKALLLCVCFLSTLFCPESACKSVTVHYNNTTIITPAAVAQQNIDSEESKYEATTASLRTSTVNIIFCGRLGFGLVRSDDAPSDWKAKTGPCIL